MYPASQKGNPGLLSRDALPFHWSADGERGSSRASRQLQKADGAQGEAREHDRAKLHPDLLRDLIVCHEGLAPDDAIDHKPAAHEQNRKPKPKQYWHDRSPLPFVASGNKRNTGPPGSLT